MNPKILEQDRLRLDEVLFALWGDGKENDFVKFSPFFSYFGAQEVSVYTDYMYFTFGHICQVFFGHTKKPTARQIEKIYRLLVDAGRLIRDESRVQLPDGRVHYAIRNIQNVIVVFTAISDDSDNCDNAYLPDDTIQAAFFKPYFNDKMAALKST